MGANFRNSKAKKTRITSTLMYGMCLDVGFRQSAPILTSRVSKLHHATHLPRNRDDDSNRIVAL